MRGEQRLVRKREERVEEEEEKEDISYRKRVGIGQGHITRGIYIVTQKFL